MWDRLKEAHAIRLTPFTTIREPVTGPVMNPRILKLEHG
jgi:hypothetical protein